MTIDWNKVRSNLSSGQTPTKTSNIDWDNVRNRLNIKPTTNNPTEAPSPVVKQTTPFNVPFKKLVEQPMSTMETPTPSATKYYKPADTTQSIRKQGLVVTKEPTKIDKFNSFAESNFPKSDTRFKKAIDLWSPKAQLLTAKDFASEMLSAADLAIRSIRSSTILASTPVAWMFDKMTGGNLSWNDIYSVTKDAAGRQIKKQDDFDKPMKDAAQLYLKNKRVKSLKDVGVDDIAVLASLGLSNLMGDPLMYLPITKVAKGLKDVANYKKVGQISKQLPSTVKNIKPVKPFDIPITPKGELKIKVIPGEQKVVVKGYVKRGYKPPTQPGAIGITEGQTVDPIVSQIEKYAGTKVNAIVDGSDLVITPTIKVTEQALTPTIEATTKEIESLTSEATVKPQEAITEVLPPETTKVSSKPVEAKIEPVNEEADPLITEDKKYKTTINIQDKNDLDYLRRILSEDNINDIKSGKMTNFRGTSYEDLARVNIISKTPQTIEQQLAGKIKEVKLNRDTFYHGTSAENADSIMSSGFKKGTELPENNFRGGGYGKIQNSISFTETPKDASRFSTLIKNGEIVEAKLKPNSKIVSIEGIEDAVELDDYIPYLRKQNIDAVYIGGGEKELVVINPKVVTPTKSQLTDIWNKEQETTLTTEAPSPIDWNKIRKEQGLPTETHGGIQEKTKPTPLYLEIVDNNLSAKPPEGEITFQELINYTNQSGAKTDGMMWTKISKEDFLTVPPEIVSQYKATPNRFPVIGKATEKMPEELATKLYTLAQEAQASDKITVTKKGQGYVGTTPNGVFIEIKPAKIKTDTKLIGGVEQIINGDPEFSKSNIKTLLDNNNEFKTNPTLVVTEKVVGNKTQKRLVFNGKKDRFEINSEALGLISDNLKVGDVIKVNTESLKINGKEFRVMKGGSAYASVGGYKDGTVIEFGGLENIKPIEIPEMVRLAKELTGTMPGTKNFAKARGMFYPKGNGTIKLDRDLFKPGQEEQLAKTLAHEIGHLIDYLPDHTMKRGNLLGSLQSLHKFTKNTFGDIEVTNKEIRKELKELSKYWRPWDEATASKSFKSYRNSPRELYADAISMMLNSPGTVERMAPKFYEAWFKNLDKKPEVATNYFKLQELMAGTREDILHARYEDVKKGFESGKIKAEQLQKEVEARNKMKIASIYERTRMEIDDINYAILKKIKKLEASGTIIPDDIHPKYLLQEMTMTDNESSIMMDNLQVEVINPLAEAGVSWDDFGIYQFLNRVINERKDIANPYGFNTKNAPEQMEYLKNLVGKEKFKLIEDSNIKYHDIIFPVIERGVSVGTINQEKFNEIILPNKYNYGTFQVIDYMQDYIPATLKGQVGTLKEISNPATATLLKTISLLRLNALNEAKGSVKNLFPSDFEKSKTITSDGKLSIAIVEKGKGEFKIMEDGKVVSYNTDPYIAEAFQSYKTGYLMSVVKIIETLNNSTFKPLYTSYNLGFILGFNPLRDFKRSYKIIKGATVRKLLFAYIDSFGSAWKYAGGELDEFTKSMVENKAIDAPINDYEFDPATNDDIYRVLQKYHLVKEDNANSWYNRNKATKVAAQGLVSLLEGMRYLGNTFEIISKIAGAKVRIAGGETGKTLAYNIRNYTGTPNWRVKGSATKTTNAIFMFSNIMKEGIKTDLQIATNPKTRAGYWWKTAKVDLMPKILMFLASAGAFGASVKKIMDDQSEYDKTNYTVIPLGEYNGKGVAMKIPSDESGRLISAVMWKMMNFAKDQELKNLTDIFSFGAGQLPSVTPVIDIPTTWIQYLSGRNPYDNWAGKLIIDDDTWNIGGGAALSKMVQWTINETGLTKFSTYDPSSNTTIENIVKLVPIINRFIKISNYGQTEELKKLQQQGVQEDAKIRLKKKELLNNYLREYKKGKMTSDDVISKTTWEVYGQNATKQNLNSVQEMATNMYLRKQNDPYISAITYATDNQDKARIIELAYEKLSFEDFKKLIETSYNFKLISVDIANQAVQRFPEPSK